MALFTYQTQDVQFQREINKPNAKSTNPRQDLQTPPKSLKAQRKICKHNASRSGSINPTQNSKSKAGSANSTQKSTHIAQDLHGRFATQSRIYKPNVSMLRSANPTQDLLTQRNIYKTNVRNKNPTQDLQDEHNIQIFKERSINPLHGLNIQKSSANSTKIYISNAR